MIQKLIDWSLSNRFVVMLLAIGLLFGGIIAMVNLPLDAVPDLTNIQVQILTKAPALGPVEVEQFITFPIETAMSGLPRVTEIRSISRFGLSAVTVVFEEGTDIYWARNLVNQRLQKAREMIPPGMADPELGPIATGMSEIYQFEVRAKPGSGYTPMDLREILDWQIAFQLRSVPGIVEVNSFGGYFKTYEVQVDPLKLHNYGVSLTRLFEVLQNNNANAGGGYIARGAELWLIRGEGLIGSLDDIADIVVDTRADGTPIRVRDLGQVRFAPMIRQGAATRDGDREAVIGMAMMLMGENSRVVVQRVKERMKEIEKTLPPGVYIDTFYDRTDLVMKTIHTVAENISGGAVLVIVMLLLLIGNLRAGLIVASAIPLSAACAFLAMKWAGVSANLMSLGAIDFGIIVDGAVVMVENCLRQAWRYRQRCKQQGSDHTEPSGVRTQSKTCDGDAVPLSVFREAAGEVGTPIFFAGLIVTIVFLPVLTLRGIEGKMFRPMAFTFMSALLGALVLSVTVMPVMASLFLARKFTSQDTFLLRWAKSAYRPLLAWAVGRPRTVFGAAVAAFLVSVLLALQLGGEFIPKLDEG
ncbi:MAG: efflux RND transporter permease subunit, partial [Planctomycetota bacterium]